MKASCRCLALTLRECIRIKAIQQGKLLHDQIAREGRDADPYLGNLLIRMYAACGRLDEARSTFWRIRLRDIGSWNAMLAACTENGHGEEAVKLYKLMAMEGDSPEAGTLASVVAACGSVAAIADGESIHEDIVAGGFELNVGVATALVGMYGKWGRMEDAERVFDRMPDRNVVTWTALLAGYSQNGRAEDAKKTFDEMPVRNLVSWTAMVSACSRAGDVDGARSLFSRTPQRNLVTWNAMLAAFAHNGHPWDALGLFLAMDMEGIPPNSVSFLTVLEACSSANAADFGRRLHDELLVHRDEDVYLRCAAAVVNMYAKCGLLEEAESSFTNTPRCNERCFNTMLGVYGQAGRTSQAEQLFIAMPCWNTVSWNAMLAGYAHSGRMSDARRLFNGMPARNEVSWNAMVSGYLENEQAAEALQVFQAMDLEGVQASRVGLVGAIYAAAAAGPAGEHLVAEVRDRKMETDPSVAAAVIHFCGKSKQVNVSREVFQALQSRSLLCWNLMVAALASNGDVDEASLVLDRMPGTDAVSWNAILTAYAQAGHMHRAEVWFNRMPSKNVVSWNTMLTGYAQTGNNDKALALFRLMDLEGVVPNKVSFLVVLDACESASALAEGRLVHDEVLARGLQGDISICTGLMSVFGKCGKLVDARAVFDQMLCPRTVVPWNAMIAAYAHNGCGHEALDIFWNMHLESSATPNAVTFLSTMVACSHAGMFKEGLECSASMLVDHGVEPTSDHCVCLVDILCRAGELDQARSLMSTMPFKVDVVAWTSLLSACRGHRDEVLTTEAAKNVLAMEPGKPGPYSLLSNIFSGE